MAQEQVAQTGAIRCTFNQPRQVGHHKALLRPDTYHTQIGVQRGERVIRNARTSVRNGCDEGRLARIGHAQQAHIGQHLQFQFEIFLLAGPARCFLAWSAVNGTLETQVAETPVTALGDGDDFARLEQLEQHFARFSVRDDGAHRHFQRDVITRGTEHIGAHAVLTALGIVAARETKVHQGIEVGVCDREHMSAAPPVAAIGTAELFVLFMPKRDAARPAVSSRDIDIGFVNELHGVLRGYKRKTPR